MLDADQEKIRSMGPQDALGWGLIQGDLSLAKQAIAAGADASAGSVIGALSYAVGQDRAACLELALAQGASPNAIFQGRSLMERAIAKGSKRCARLLLPLAELTCWARGESSALEAAKNRGDHRLAKLIAAELARREALELSLEVLSAQNGVADKDANPLRL